MDFNHPSQLVQLDVWNNVLRIIPATKHGGGEINYQRFIIIYIYIKVVCEQCLLHHLFLVLSMSGPYSILQLKVY